MPTTTTSQVSPQVAAQEPPTQDQHGFRDRVRALHERGLSPILVLAVLVAVVAAYDSSFLQPASLTALLDQAAPLVLLSLAQAMVVITGRITLANAALASLLGVVLARTLGAYGQGAVLGVLVTAVVVGAVIGGLHMWTQVPSFIITLGALGIFAGLSLWVSNADSIFISDGYAAVEWISLRLYGVPISFLLVLLIAGVLMAVFALFPIGRAIRAVGLNERAAAYSGVRTGAVVVMAFAISGLLSGLAAVSQVAQLQSAGASTSDSLLLPSIAAVILGGTSISGGVGGVGRTVVGALIVALLRVGLDLVGVPSAVQPIVYGVIVIAAIAATVDRRRGVAAA
ncbi:MAG TPA: ABC transporter permease [Intrasporangium sp.]|uniref:ABC transporter permease n=1 Tax=Intrasporangium sp. TaxID=1925024 RepID=UPI002D782B04|nr:ABC transporter permease [Intrasporangium sp.]HET7398243.1 ABC transporter permease [Intrasporangium sp.]